MAFSAQRGFFLDVESRSVASSQGLNVLDIFFPRFLHNVYIRIYTTSDHFFSFPTNKRWGAEARASLAFPPTNVGKNAEVTTDGHSFNKHSL
jgi:hypothetical protein